MGFLSFAVLLALPVVGSLGTKNGVFEPGTFQNPSSRVRPRFRYWLPDADVDLEQVTQDIQDVGKIGAGGVEVLGYYAYGDIEQGPSVIPTDWTKYGWGTPAWRDVQDTALQATKDAGLVVDFALGPNQGAGVPAESDDEGLQWDLQPFNTTIAPGDEFSGVIPGWGTGALVSATLGLVINSTNSSSVVTNVLSHESLQDVTSEVTVDGQLNLTTSSGASGEYYVLFTNYLVHSGYREQQTPPLVIAGVPQSPVTNFVENGSWVVDHFSARGAETVAGFWNAFLLNGSDTKTLLKEVGNYLWEDSQEYPQNVPWTKDLPAKFQANRGYSVSEYIPILYGNNLNAVSGSSIEAIYITDEEDSGYSHIFDFQQTLTELNAEYLKGLTEFANSLGLQSSAQVVYNMPMDMLANVPDVDAPECESLGFSNDIDSYRQYAGPANLAGKRVVSSECGAKPASVYQLAIPELLYEIKRSVVGGINNFILHGHPYGGSYPNTTWPSYTTFGYLFAEMHSHHLPAWDYYKDWIEYVGRLQYIGQTGTARLDLAFYQKKNSYLTVPTSYEPTDLQDAGYSYEYLSPDDFLLSSAFVSDGILAPTQQAFKALIVGANDTITPLGLTKLLDWASAGLTVILAGGLPSNFTGASTSSFIAGLKQLTSIKTVKTVPAENLAQSIASLGIKPRVSSTYSTTESTTWYSRFWKGSDDQTSYAFIYNDASGLTRGQGSSTRNVTFETTGVPFVYNAWTGEEIALTSYKSTQDATTIRLSLAGNQTALIAFKQGSSRTKNGWGRPEQTILIGQNESNDSSSINPYLGYNVVVSENGPSSLTLNNWTLTIEAWQAPADLYDIEGTIKTNTTYNIPELLPWNELPVANLTYVSGRGYYKSTFDWPSSGGSHQGAIIDLGSVLHTVVVYINGKRLPPLDFSAANADITSYLSTGKNEVEIVVSTPYGNSLYPVWSELRSAGNVVPSLTGLGSFFGSSLISIAEYGLVGEVLIRPYNVIGH